MGYKSHAQRKAVWASKKDGGKGNPNSPAKMVPTSLRKKRKTQQDIRNEAVKNIKPHKNRVYEQKAKHSKSSKLKEAGKKYGNFVANTALQIIGTRGVTHEKVSPFKLKPKSPLMGKISASCKARAKKKFKVWPSAYASGWGVRCTQGKV